MKYAIKNTLRFSALLAAVFLLGGCIVVNGSARFVTGKGAMQSTDFEVGEYSSVSISGGMELIYTNGVSNVVTVEIQENLLEYLTVSVKNGKLSVRAERNFRVDSKKTPKVYITTPTFSQLSIDGAVNFTDSDTIEGDSFTLDLAGAGSVDISLDVKKLNVLSSGASNIDLRGSADRTIIQIDGAGSVDAYSLETLDSEITLNGVGNCSINCSDTLDVTINGIGSLTYTGDPEITKHIGGLGSVKKD